MSQKKQRSYQIGNEELLDATEERKLSKLIEAGSRAQETLDEREGTLTAKEKNLLEIRVRRGERARHRFVMANTRLVESILGKTTIPQEVDSADLFQDACIALDTAVQKFDWRKGFKFSTYGSLWIRQAIRNGIRKQLGVVGGASLLQTQYETMQRIRSDPVFREHYGVNGPGDDEVAAIMQVSPERFKVIAAWHRGVLSFEQPVGSVDDQSLRLGDTISDARADEMFEGVDLSDRRELIIRMTEDLPSEEAVALQRTLDGDGPAVGTSPKQHRHAAERAMSRIRHPTSPHASAVMGYIT